MSRTRPAAAPVAAWIPAAVGGCAVLVGVLVALRGRVHDVALWGLPIWQVTYRSGFIRRGLVGTVFQSVAGGLAAPGQADLVPIVADVLLLTLIVAYAGWLAILSARATSPGHAAALGLLALPILGSSLFPTLAFTPGYLDVVMLLAAIAVGALLAHGHIWAAVAIGALAPLAHEMFIVLWVPLAIMAVALADPNAPAARHPRRLLALALPVVSTALVVLASSRSAAHREITVHVTGSADFKATLLHQQFGQDLVGALRRMAHIQGAYWWPAEPVAIVYFCWPGVLAIALYMVWRRRQLDAWARAALVLALACPWLMLLVAWDLSRLLILGDGLALIVILGLETAFIRTPLCRLRAAGWALLGAAGVLAMALPFLYANFGLYATYHRNAGPVPYDLMPVLHPLLAHAFTLR